MSSNPNVERLITTEESKDIRELLRAQILKDFTSEGAEQRLMRALKDGTPYVIYHLARIINDIDHGRQEPEPFPGWPEFANTLLLLAEAEPNVGLPLLEPFIAVSGRSFDERAQRHWIADVRSERLDKFFDAEAQATLRRLFRAWHVPESVDSQTSAAFDAIKQWAEDGKFGRVTERTNRE